MREKIVLRLLFLGLIISNCLCTWANGPGGGVPSAGKGQELVTIYFNIGKSDINLSVKSNRTELNQLISNISTIFTEDNSINSHIVITGAASLDGKERVNDILARRRAEKLADYIIAHTDVDLSKIKIINGGEDWAGLRQLVVNSNMPFRQDVITVIDCYLSLRDKKRLLMSMADGKPWAWMNENLFPILRFGNITVSIVSDDSDLSKTITATTSSLSQASDSSNSNIVTPNDETNQLPIESDELLLTTEQIEPTVPVVVVQRKELVERTESAVATENIIEQVESAELTENSQSVELTKNSEESSKALVGVEPLELPESDSLIVAKMPFHSDVPLFFPRVAIKTDLLLLSGIMPNLTIGTYSPNLSIEAYFARKWSVQAGWSYSNWKGHSDADKLFAVSSFSFEGRYWFSQPLAYRGLFLGVAAGFGDYDLHNNTTGNTGVFWRGGIGVGYLLPMGNHWALEAELLGYYKSSNNASYDIEGVYYYQNKKSVIDGFDYQLRLQLVYRFGCPRK